jgi:hypothetical protein
MTDNRENYRRYWWQFAERRPGLTVALRSLDHVIVISRVTHQLGFAVLPAKMVHGESLVVVTSASQSLQGILQSRVHEIWARFFASSLEDRLRYGPSDCFETFPFPMALECNAALERASCSYFELRASVMLREKIGLTTVYNWFHDPECDGLDALRLRELQDAMDRAAFDAYGWTGIHPRCEFFPEFNEEEDDSDNGRPRRKRYRYRWPDEACDDVLARLLELNRQRALEEGHPPTELPVFAGMSDPEPKAKGSKKKAGKRASEDLNLSLLPQEKEEA